MAGVPCHPAVMSDAEVLLLGGRAGVGKTTVGWEVSALLRAVEVSHAVIEGDFMGQVHPPPEGDPHRAGVTEDNLTAVWGNFARRGYRRLIYTNTVSVLPEAAGMFERAMGSGVRIVRVLLTASDATAGERLTARELGSELETELRGSARKARLLDERAPRTPCEWRPTGGRSATSPARWWPRPAGPSGRLSPGGPKVFRSHRDDNGRKRLRCAHQTPRAPDPDEMALASGSRDRGTRLAVPELASQRPPWRDTSMGRPKQAVIRADVSTSSARPPARTRPSRRSSAWPIAGDSSSRWWVTVMVANPLRPSAS